ncbi:MAG: hypothetical protein KIS81_11650 [Maricaulaceae bacterium]|nr:hypothetical protein [Maricaulaceae bacterium]
MFRWSAPIVLESQYAYKAPRGSGVFSLRASQNPDGEMLFIGASHDLNGSFKNELARMQQEGARQDLVFAFIETPTPYDLAERLMAEFKRKFGRRPALNSVF